MRANSTDNSGFPKGESKEDDPVISQSDKIISNFKHIFPISTSVEELKLLASASIEIIKSKIRSVVKEKNGYIIQFKLSTNDFERIRPSIPEIEANLKRKANIIFKSFPDCWLVDIRILSSNPS